MAHPVYMQADHQYESRAGYGHIFPVTATGKMVCIVYTLVGCMLLITFMAEVSDDMAKGIKRIYRCVQKMCIIELEETNTWGCILGD